MSQEKGPKGQRVEGCHLSRQAIRALAEGAVWGQQGPASIARVGMPCHLLMNEQPRYMLSVQGLCPWRTPSALLGTTAPCRWKDRGDLQGMRTCRAGKRIWSSAHPHRARQPPVSECPCLAFFPTLGVRSTLSINSFPVKLPIGSFPRLNEKNVIF